MIPNLKRLFSALNKCLEDDSHGIVFQTIMLVTELFDNMGPERENLSVQILPNLVKCMGDRKPSVSESAWQFIRKFLSETQELEVV